MNRPEDDLARRDFALALQKGLGRVRQYVSQHGLEHVDDLLLAACLEDQSLDPQCEPSRAAWLWQMVDGTEHESAFKSEILDRLETEAETWNLVQLCELAAEMAARGDQLARRALHERVLAKAAVCSSDEWVGADLWVELEGLEGLLDLVRIYGQRLLADSQDAVTDTLLNFNSTARALESELQPYAESEPAVRAYLDFIEASRREAREWREQRQSESPANRSPMFSLKQILRGAQCRRGAAWGRYRIFGRMATAEELNKVYAQLLKTQDAGTQLRLLSVFTDVKMPQLPRCLFVWAVGRHKELRSAAIRALEHFCDPRIQTLARNKVRKRHLLGPDSWALSLFLNHYEPADAPMIAEALACLTPDPDEAHDLTRSLLQLSKRHGDPALAAALNWAYESGHCTDCRHQVLQELERLNALNQNLLAECCHDAKQAIRNWAEQKSGSMAE